MGEGDKWAGTVKFPLYTTLIAGHAEPNCSVQDLSICPSPLTPKS